MPMRPLVLQYHKRPVASIKYNRDGDLIASASTDQTISLIKEETGERIGTFHGHEGAVKSIDFSRDSSMLVSAGMDSRVCFFEVKTGEVIFTLLCGGILKSVEFNQHPTKTNMIVTCADKFRSTPNNISVWKFTDRNDPTGNTCFYPKSKVQFAKVHQDGSAISDPSEAQLEVLESNYEDFRVEHVCEINESQLPMKANQVRWGPFDETILSSHEEGTVYVWRVPHHANPETGEPSQVSLLKCLDAHTMPIKSISFNTTLPNINHNNENQQFPTGERTLMLTASRDKTVKLWETQEYTWLKTYQATRPLNDAVISPLYQLEGNANSEEVSKVSKGKSKKDDDFESSIPTIPRFHMICAGGVDAMNVTTSSEAEFESCFFHLVSCEELCRIKGHFGPVNCVAVNPMGTSFCTGGEDGMVRLIHFDKEYFERKDL